MFRLLAEALPRKHPVRHSFKTLSACREHHPIACRPGVFLIFPMPYSPITLARKGTCVVHMAFPFPDSPMRRRSPSSEKSVRLPVASLQSGYASKCFCEAFWLDQPALEAGFSATACSLYETVFFLDWLDRPTAISPSLCLLVLYLDSFP